MKDKQQRSLVLLLAQGSSQHNIQDQLLKQNCQGFYELAFETRVNHSFFSKTPRSKYISAKSAFMGLSTESHMWKYTLKILELFFLLSPGHMWCSQSFFKPFYLRNFQKCFDKWRTEDISWGSWYTYWVASLVLFPKILQWLESGKWFFISHRQKSNLCLDLHQS